MFQKEGQNFQVGQAEPPSHCLAYLAREESKNLPTSTTTQDNGLQEAL